MSPSRREFLKAGVATAAVSSFGCGVLPRRQDAVTKKVEFRAKGTFAFVKKKGSVTSPLVILPKGVEGDIEHDLLLFAQRKWVANRDDGSWMAADEDRSPEGWLQRKVTQKTVDILGAGFQPSPPPAVEPSLSDNDWCPRAPLKDDARWIDPRFIASFDRNGKDLKLRSDWTDYAARHIRVPNGTQWYGRAPRYACDQMSMWEFRDKNGNGKPLKQAITDIVAWRGDLESGAVINFYDDIVLPEAQIASSRATGQLVVDLTPDGEPTIWLLAVPSNHSGDHECVEVGKPLPHYKMLHNLTANPDADYFVPYRDAVDCPTEGAGNLPIQARAYDIFCPGGEIEGG